jgi:hypothetical protein
MWNNHRPENISKLQDIIAVAKPQLSKEEIELLTKYEDIFAMDSKDYR